MAEIIDNSILEAYSSYLYVVDGSNNVLVDSNNCREIYIYIYIYIYNKYIYRKLLYDIDIRDNVQ